jgi:DNA-binding NarL/FixJ family response regulator
MATNVKIILVDDHTMVRAGLKALLQRESGLSVVGEGSTGREAVKLVRELSPDVVVMDLRMPDLNGIDAARQIIAIKPDVKVIGLSASTDERSCVEMVRAGAVGFVAKESAFEDLTEAIRTVMDNRMFFGTPALFNIANIETKRGSGVETSAFTVLSPREREVLQLMSEGRATKEIAASLKISVKTAETHRRSLMEKLKVDSVAELTKYAIREGLTSL